MTQAISPVTILDGSVFVVSDSAGDIEASPTDPVGLFGYDTRFLSTWVLRVNGQKLHALSVDDVQYFEARFFLVPGHQAGYVDSSLSLVRHRSMRHGFDEQLIVLNHGDEPAQLTFRIEAGSDFADIFEVKDALGKKGTHYVRVEDDRLIFGYQRETFHRATTVTADVPAEYDSRGLTFVARVDAHAEWSARLSVAAAIYLPTRGNALPRWRKGHEALERDLDALLNKAPTLKCDWQPLRDIYHRSIVDLAALRFAPEVAKKRTMPAAGLPWFMTTFGRDSIFTSLQALPFDAELAQTTLQVLADWQGFRVEDRREEEPGRIAHEVRYGESTAFRDRPHGPYYGTADATPLFVVLLDEYERWTGDSALVRTLEYEARAALDWIDRYGDLTGTGYISYRRRNEARGLENQCWKDSWDSISYRDGRLPGFPRATCELQGLRVRRQDARRAAGTGILARPGLRRPARTGGRRPSRALRTRLLDRRPAVLRVGSGRRRQPGRRAVLQHRAPAVERHRPRGAGTAGRGPPDGPEAVLRLGDPHAEHGRGAVQPDRVPRRHRVAVRQLHHRVGPATVPVQDRGGAGRRADPRRGPVLQQSPARGVRRL
jgi:glycogen debranching enzyme